MPEQVKPVLEFMSTHVELVIIGIFLLIFLIHFIKGLIDGRRYATYKWITTIIFGVGLVLLTPLILNIMYNVDIASKITISNPNEATNFILEGKTLYGMVDKALIYYLGSADPNVKSLIIGIVSCFIKVILYTFAIIVIQIPYRILVWVIYMIFFKRKEKKDKNGIVVKAKPKKHALMGGLLNGLRHCVVFGLMMVILVNGPLGLASPELIDKATEATTSEQTNLSSETPSGDQTNEIVINILKQYYNTVFYKTTNKIGLNDAVNNFIFTFKLEDGTKFNLRKAVVELIDLVEPIYNIYETTRQEESFDYRSLDPTDISTILNGLADSQIFSVLLPVLVPVAAETDEVKSKLSEFNITAEDLKGIDWSNDLRVVASVVEDTYGVIEGVEFIPNEEQAKTIEYLDLTSIDAEKVKSIFYTLSNLTIINVAANALVDYALKLDSVKQALGEVTLDVENIVWSDTFKDLGDIYKCIGQLSLTSLNALKENYPQYFETFDFSEEGPVANLFKAIFGNAFIKKNFSKIMESVVYEKIPDQYRSLFDFTALRTKGWENEIIDLLSIFKDVQDGSDPLFDDEGKLNLNIVKNIRAETLLKSELISTTLINAISSINTSNEGDLLYNLKGYVKVPDVYNNSSYSGWKSTYVAKYVCNTDYTDGGIEHKSMTTISVEEYNALSESYKEYYDPIYYINGGEIYNLLNGISSLSTIIDFDNLNMSIVSNELLSKMIEGNETNSSIVNKLSSSMILRTSLTSLLNSATDQIIIPDSACESVLVNGEATKIVSEEELVNTIRAIIKLEIIKDPLFTVKELISQENIHYDVNQTITKEQYDALNSENKQKVDIKLQVALDASILNKLDEHEYKCVVATTNYKVDDLISEETYNKLNQVEKDCFVKTQRIISDYVLGSEDGSVKGSKIIGATISKFILETEEVAVPVSVVENDGVDVISSSELRAMVRTVNALDVVKTIYKVNAAFGPYNVGDELTKEEYDALDANSRNFVKSEITIKADLSMVDTLLYIVDDQDNTKLDYILGNSMINESKILLATVSDLIIKQSTLENPDNMIVITTNDYTLVDKYHSQNQVRLLNKEELKNIVSLIVKLDVFENDKLSVDLSLLSKLETTYTYKAEETPSYISGVYSDSKPLLDYLDDTKILTHTISKALSNFEDTIIIPASVTDDSGYIGVNEIKSLIRSVNILDIIKTTYKATANKGNYHVGDVISATEYEALANSDKEIFEKQTNVDLDLNFVSEMLYIVDEQNNTKLDYMLGNSNISGSDILLATLSNLVIEQSTAKNSNNMIVVNTSDYVLVDRYESDAKAYLLNKDELRTLISLLVKLDIFKDGKVVVDVDLLKTLETIYTYKQEETPSSISGVYTDTKQLIDYLDDSSILSHTISKAILDMSDSIIIPETALDESQYVKTAEIKALVRSINKLDVLKVMYECISQVGSYNVGNLISKEEYEALSESYKEHFEKTSHADVDLSLLDEMLYIADASNNTKLDYIVGNSTITPSNILLATLSDVLVNESTLVNQDNFVVIVEGQYVLVNRYGSSTKAYMLDSNELRQLISIIVKLGLVENGQLNANLSMLDKLETIYTYKNEETPSIISGTYKDSKAIIEYLDDTAILSNTISKAIFELGDSIIVPAATLNANGYISTSELKALIRGVNALGIVETTYEAKENIGSYHVGDKISKEEYEALSDQFKESFDASDDVNVGINILEEMLVISDSYNNTKLDYLVGNANITPSAILLTTISKYICDESNIYDDNNPLVIPNNAYSIVSTKDGYSCLINTNELRKMIEVIVKLGLVDGESIDAGLSTIAKLENKYTYKAKETPSIVSNPYVDDKMIIEYVNESIIMSSTISKYILDSKDSIVILDNVVENNSIKPNEFINLVHAINELGIISTYKYNGSLINIFVDENRNYISDSVYDSLSESLKANYSKITLSDNCLVDEFVRSGAISLGINQNCFSALDNPTIANLNDIASKILENKHYQVELSKSLILVSTISDLISDTLDLTIDGISYESNSDKSVLVSFDEYKQDTSSYVALLRYICKSDVLSYVKGDIINESTYNSLNTSVKAKFEALQVIDSEELLNIFNSINALGISSFDDIDIDLGLVFNLYTDDKLVDVLDSVTIWNLVSNNIENMTSGEESMFEDISVNSGVSYAIYNNNNYPISYALGELGSYNINTKYAYYNSDGVVRLNKEEINSIVGVLNILIDDPDNATSFNISAEELESIYQNDEKALAFSKAFAKSVLMLYSVKNMTSNAIDSSLANTMFESRASDIKDKLEVLSSVDKLLYDDFDGFDSEFDYQTYHNLNDNQMYKLLVALRAVSNIGDYTDFTEELLLDIDASFILRDILSEVVVVYEATEAFSTYTDSYNAGDKLSIAEYYMAYYQGKGSKMTSITYNANDSKSNRLSLIEEFADLNL